MILTLDIQMLGDGVLIQNLNDPTKPIIGLIYEVWTDDAETQGFTANWFLRPEQTVHKASTKFMENEVFKTNHTEHYTVKDIEGRCAILYVRDYTRGRPPGFTFENTFVVESRYNEQAKNFSKIKNWSVCLPDSLKNVEPDLELFSAPIVPVRVASAFAEVLAKREAESSVDYSDVEIPEKRAYKKRAPAERKVCLQRFSFFILHSSLIEMEYRFRASLLPHQSRLVSL